MTYDDGTINFMVYMRFLLYTGYSVKFF